MITLPFFILMLASFFAAVRFAIAQEAAGE
jgi:hypothetical protein